MTDVKQQVKTGDRSTVVQAATVVIHQGMSDAEVKQFALQVFEENFPRLELVAKETAFTRANELVNHLLQVTDASGHKKFEQLALPRKQNDFINAQKAYAFSDGEEIIKETLCNLINQSLNENNEQSLTSISASVAIQTVANLTKIQLLILAAHYYQHEVAFLRFDTHESFIKSTETHFEKIGIFELGGIKQSDFVHLEAMNCVAINPMRGDSLWSFLLKKYPGVFASGLTDEEVDKAFSQAECDPIGIIECTHNKDKKQVGYLHESQINDELQSGALSIAQATTLKKLLTQKLMNANQVKELFSAHSEKILHISSLWDSSIMNRIRLTTIGKAIGYNVTASRLQAKHLHLQFH